MDRDVSDSFDSIFDYDHDGHLDSEELSSQYAYLDNQANESRGGGGFEDEEDFDDFSEIYRSNSSSGSRRNIPPYSYHEYKDKYSEERHRLLMFWLGFAAAGAGLTCFNYHPFVGFLLIVVGVVVVCKQF